MTFELNGELKNRPIQQAAIIPVGFDATGKPAAFGVSAAVQASGTLTASGTVSDGDIVKIDGQPYTARTALTVPAVAYEVLIGGSQAVFLDKLKLAVTLTGTAGTDYGTGTKIHPTVDATTNTNTTQLFVAREAGVDGNRIATVVVTGANLSFGATTFTGGLNGKLQIEQSAAATFAQINKTVASVTVPEAIAGSTTLCESVEITALKGRDTANTGNVFIGFSATNDTQLTRLVPGESKTFTAPPGKKLDLAGFYVDVATAGDGVIATYLY
jgi:hypothetical protein